MSAKKEVTAPATEETAAVQKKKEVHDLMYLGPSIVGVVRHSTVFKNGILPEKAKECINVLPMMEKLFVPIGDMPKAVKEIKKDQSVLHTIYIQVAKKFV